MKQFLIIGLGSIGRRHARNLHHLYPDAQFSFLRRSNTSDELVDALSGQTFNELDRAMTKTYDLIVLATPSALHIDLLPRLIESGASLLVEKPVVTSLEDCDKCIELLAASSDAVRVAGFNFRYLASLQLARKMVTDGGLGEIVSASFRAGQWLPDWRPNQDYRSGYGASVALGGGVELDLVHEIDVARWIFGDLNLEYAIGRKTSRLEIETNDVARLIFSSPVSGVIIDVGLDYVSRQRVRRYEIVGDEGTLIWNLDGSLRLIRKDQVTTLDEDPSGFDVSASYIDMIRYLMSAKAGNWPIELQSLSDGIASSKLAIESRIKGTHQ